MWRRSLQLFHAFFVTYITACVCMYVLYFYYIVMHNCRLVAWLVDRSIFRPLDAIVHSLLRWSMLFLFFFFCHLICDYVRFGIFAVLFFALATLFFNVPERLFLFRFIFSVYMWLSICIR